jgi:hypothetical protein
MTPQEEDDALIREEDVKQQPVTDDAPPVESPDAPEEAAHREQEMTAMYGSLRSSDPQYITSSLGEDEDPKSSLESENEPS